MINHTESFVYAMPGMDAGTGSFTSFDLPLEGGVNVDVLTTWKTESVEVYPLNRGIVPVVDNHRVRFNIKTPGQYFIKFNGCFEIPLYLFANAPAPATRQFDPTSARVRVFKPGEHWWDRISSPQHRTDIDSDADVYYFGPGEHMVGTLWLRDGETLYLAPGAVVHAVVQAHKAERIRICGRGILCYSGIPHGGGTFGPTEAIGLRECRHVVIEDITVMDGFGWTIVPYDCANVQIRNVKIINERLYSTDGINPVNSRDILIEDCFIRCKDDNISIKGLCEIARRQLQWSPIENITIRRCVLWSNNNNAVVVGAESKAPYIRNISIKDCDILKATGIAGDCSAALSVVLLDDTLCENIAFENINIEFTTGHLFHVSFQDRMFTLLPGIRRPQGGTVRNIVFRNITLLDGLHRTSFIHGAPGRSVNNVLFSNLAILGRKVTTLEDAKIHVGEHATEIRIE